MGVSQTLFLSVVFNRYASLPATDDPIYGNKEGGFFHGYYGHYCYLPLYIFTGEHLPWAGGGAPLSMRPTAPWTNGRVPDHEHVALPQGAQAAVESGPVVAYAGSKVVVGVGWVVDALGPQGAALQVQRLGAIRLCDMRAKVPSCQRLRVSYSMSYSMSCIRRTKEHGSN